MMGWNNGWGMMGGGLSMLLFTIIVVLLIVWLIRSVSSSTGDRPGNSALRQTPEEILRERFARGEIDEDEYRQRQQSLTR